MPERLECEVLQKARYINTLTFTFTFNMFCTDLNGNNINVFYASKTAKKQHSAVRGTVAEPGRRVRQSRDRCETFRSLVEANRTICADLQPKQNGFSIFSIFRGPESDIVVGGWRFGLVVTRWPRPT